MSDTWSSIQAHKKQLDSLRERLQRRRKQDPLGEGHFGMKSRGFGGFWGESEGFWGLGR